MAVTVRSISQLPTVLSGQIPDPNSRMNISQYETGGVFMSRGYMFGDLSSHMNQLISSTLDNAAHLVYDEQFVNISALYERVSSWVGTEGRQVVMPSAEFQTYPTVKNGLSAADGRDVTTVDDAINLINTRNVFVRSTSYGKYPFTDDMHTDDDSANYDVRFQFIQNYNTGEQASDSNPYRETNVVEVPETGYLVIWGWLADDGSVPPEFAWTGLFVYDDSDQTSVKYHPLQIQPWILGQYSRQLQYVGFQAPVQKGTKLVIKTGFNVDTSNNPGGYQNYRSLTTRDYEPNTLFGVIARVGGGEQS